MSKPKNLIWVRIIISVSIVNMAKETYDWNRINLHIADIRLGVSSEQPSKR